MVYAELSADPWPSPFTRAGWNRTIQLQWFFTLARFQVVQRALSSDPALCPCFPSGRPQEWRHMHLQPGNLIQVEGVGEAVLGAFVCLLLDNFSFPCVLAGNSVQSSATDLSKW